MFEAVVTVRQLSHGKLWCIGFFLALLLVVGCESSDDGNSQGTHRQTVISSGKRILNSDWAISCVVPDNWRVTMDPMLGEMEIGTRSTEELLALAFAKKEPLPDVYCCQVYCTHLDSGSSCPRDWTYPDSLIDWTKYGVDPDGNNRDLANVRNVALTQTSLGSHDVTKLSFTYTGADSSTCDELWYGFRTGKCCVLVSADPNLNYRDTLENIIASFRYED
jgi:hypothetical protein